MLVLIIYLLVSILAFCGMLSCKKEDSLPPAFVVLTWPFLLFGAVVGGTFAACIAGAFMCMNLFFGGRSNE